MQNTLPELITPRTLATRWGLSEKTLERWRMTGTGQVTHLVEWLVTGRPVYRL